MKFIVAALFCFAATAHALNQAVVDEFKGKLKAKFEFCVNQEKASSADVEAFMAKTWPTSHEAKCVLFCMHKKCHVQNEDGSLNVNGALEGLSVFKEDQDVYEKLVSTVKDCGSSVASNADPCEYAMNLAKCFVDTQKTNGLGKVLIK